MHERPYANRQLGGRPSPLAAQALEAVLEAADDDAEELVGETDCEQGCTVEIDGTCAHGWLSAARTAGLV